MMTRLLLCALLMACCLPARLAAQSGNMIKELESRRGELLRQIEESEALLQSTGKDVGSQLDALSALTAQIEERKRYMKAINDDMKAIDREVASLQRQIAAAQRELEKKKSEYAGALRYLHRHRTVQDKLMFIFSAENLAQMYRRMRYVREYADFHRKQGEEILRKQEQTEARRNELMQARDARKKLLAEREEENKKLEEQEAGKKKIVEQLRSRQRALQNELAKKRREAERLNSRIDKLIAEELEKERKRADAEAKRSKKQDTAVRQDDKAATAETYTPDKATQRLSGNFASNRGKLPVPITGPYIITGHYGRYTVKELRNVVLDNKGIDIQGQPGSQARAVFDGKVAAVFKLDGLLNVLVRHGAYISVYCNLTSTSVKTGDSVATGQPLGQVYSNPADGGRTVLHFQLRKEKEKLNPEPWLDVR